MNNPLVSVHMVTYNHEPYIAQAIEGVLLQQTSFPVELVVGEDCSTDGTRDIVFDYQRRYPELIRVITSDRNVGGNANSLRIREACRGKYIAYCDGDDYWTDPNKLQRQVDFLQANPEYSICCHDVEVVTEGVPRIKRYVEFSKDTFSFADAVKGHFIPTLSIVCRREPISTLPEWVTQCISGDIPMELLVLDTGLGYYIHEKMGVKRDNPGGVTQTPGRRKMARYSFLRMYKQLNAHTKGRHRSILRPKIAELSLEIATGHRRAGRRLQFLRYFLGSLLYDRAVVYSRARRYLAPGGRTSAR